MGWDFRGKKSIHPSAKLNEQDVIDILVGYRAIKDEGRQVKAVYKKEMSEKYHVHHATICDILNGNTWLDVNIPEEYSA